MTPGGDGCGSGEEHPSFGKKRTPEQCAAISAGNTGSKHTEEQNAAKSIRQTGMKRTPETCAAISASRVGSKNPYYNHTIYNFEHRDGTTFSGTKYEFRMKYNLNSGHVGAVVSGTCKTIKGWHLVS